MQSALSAQELRPLSFSHNCRRLSPEAFWSSVIFWPGDEVASGSSELENWNTRTKIQTRRGLKLFTAIIYQEGEFTDGDLGFYSVSQRYTDFNNLGLVSHS